MDAEITEGYILAGPREYSSNSKSSTGFEQIPWLSESKIFIKSESDKILVIVSPAYSLHKGKNSQKAGNLKTGPQTLGLQIHMHRTVHFPQKQTGYVLTGLKSVWNVTVSIQS